MYLHKSKRKDGRVYLALVEGYREDGKVKHRTVESLGYLDELERGARRPHSALQAGVRRGQRRGEDRAAERADRDPPQQKIDRRKAARKNIGSAVLLAVYGALGVEQVVRNHFKQRGSPSTPMPS